MRQLQRSQKLAINRIDEYPLKVKSSLMDTFIRINQRISEERLTLNFGLLDTNI